MSKYRIREYIPGDLSFSIFQIEKKGLFGCKTLMEVSDWGGVSFPYEFTSLEEARKFLQQRNKAERREVTVGYHEA